MKTYTLQELQSLNIDSWVNAMSEVAERFGYLVDGYNDDDCPAEYEVEFNALAKDGKMRFSEQGKLVSWDVLKIALEKNYKTKENKMMNKPITKRVAIKAKYSRKDGYVVAKSWNDGILWSIKKRQYKRAINRIGYVNDYLILNDARIDEILVVEDDWSGYYAVINNK